MRFREGRAHVLVCTDLLARGIDFLNVNTVVNYDFPLSAVDYVHRCLLCTCMRWVQLVFFCACSGYQCALEHCMHVCKSSMGLAWCRIGRTGRAGRSGAAITFFEEKDAGAHAPLAGCLLQALLRS